MMIRNYKDLKVWQHSRALVKEIYRISQPFPQAEQFGLTSQIRRAAASIPSNIAEGHSRNSTKEYVQFLSIAIGSLAEVETQLLLSVDLEFSEMADIQPVLATIHETQRMLHSLRNKLKSSNP